MGNMSPRLKARRGRFGAGGLAPIVTITSPDSRLSFAGIGSPGAVDIAVTATAIDDVDGDISSSIIWSSDVDGNVGTGASDTLELSVGDHVLTATATATSGSPQVEASDSITVTVTPA